MSKKFAITNDDNGLTTLLLIRPNKLNALNHALSTELQTRILAVQPDASLDSMISHGARKCFFVSLS